MPGRAAKVVITERQQEILEEFSRSRSESQMTSQRATIILRSFQGGTNQMISAAVGLNRMQVGVWRRRWQAAGMQRTPSSPRGGAGDAPGCAAAWGSRRLHRRAGRADPGGGV